MSVRNLIALAAIAITASAGLLWVNDRVDEEDDDEAEEAVATTAAVNAQISDDSPRVLALLKVTTMFGRFRCV